jgi:hypothetical protein
MCPLSLSLFCFQNFKVKPLSEAEQTAGADIKERQPRAALPVHTGQAVDQARRMQCGVPRANPAA